MTIDVGSISELAMLWAAIALEQDKHFNDDSPKDFAAFLKLVNDEDRTLFVIRKGSKVVGWIGVQIVAPVPYLRGIHFIPEARGQGIAMSALQSVLFLLFKQGAKAVRADYMDSNKGVAKFLYKAGCIEVTSEAKRWVKQAGEDVLVETVEFTFDGEPMVKLA